MLVKSRSVPPEGRKVRRGRSFSEGLWECAAGSWRDCPPVGAEMDLRQMFRRDRLVLFLREITQLEIRVESRDEMAAFPRARDGIAAPQSVLRCPPAPPSHPPPPHRRIYQSTSSFSSTHTSCLALFGSRREGVESNTS